MKRYIVVLLAVLALGCTPALTVAEGDHTPVAAEAPAPAVAPAPPQPEGEPVKVSAQQRMDEAQERLGRIIEGAANLEIARVSTVREIQALQVILDIEANIKKEQASRAETEPPTE